MTITLDLFSPAHLFPAQMVVVVPRVEPPPPLPSGAQAMLSATWLISIFLILVGVVIGVLVSIRYLQAPRSDNQQENRLSNDTDTPPQISLGTLQGSNGDIILRECYARALKARNLITADNLIMIDPNEIALVRTIGEGSFGRVWSGIWRNNSVAVKEFVFAQTAVSGGSQQVSSLVEEIIGEAAIMTCLRNPKILQLYGCTMTLQAMWIVCELCERGSLRMLLDDASTFLDGATKASIALDIADGMMYLHQRNPPIIHRDLKSHNIFITEQAGKFVAKIGDWGSARAMQMTRDRSSSQGVGTACWLAPEVILRARYSKESDVYAFGIILWEIYTRLEVHARLSAPQIIAKVANDGLRPPIPLGCPWEEIMRKCWSTQPAQRPGSARIIAVLVDIYNKEKEMLLTTPQAPQHLTPPQITPLHTEQIGSKNKTVEIPSIAPQARDERVSHSF
jgi:serine/threonine protein kinase